MTELMRVCRTIVAALVLIASVLGSTAIRADEPGKMKLGEFIPAAPPQPAPEISFTDTAGNPASLADFKGRFVLLNLWATWCQPCLKEMPSLAALQAKLGPALTVLAVSEDRGGAEVVQPFVAKHDFAKLKIYLDPKSTRDPRLCRARACRAAFWWSTATARYSARSRAAPNGIPTKCAPRSPSCCRRQKPG